MHALPSLTLNLLSLLLFPARIHKKEKTQQRKRRIAKKLKAEEKEKRRAAWREEKEAEELENNEDGIIVQTLFCVVLQYLSNRRC